MFIREVMLLKSLWDMITLVKSSFEDWNTTLWSDINVEQMEMDCKKFVKVSNHTIHYLPSKCTQPLNHNSLYPYGHFPGWKFGTMVPRSRHLLRIPV